MLMSSNFFDTLYLVTNSDTLELLLLCLQMIEIGVEWTTFT